MATSNTAGVDESLRKWILEQTNKMQNDLFTSIREETPVKTGRAQDGWENIPIARVGDVGYIKNDVPYIGWLEFGSDTIAPTAMVRRNIKRVIK